MNLPELFTRNNKKKDQCFRHNFTQKYANRDIIAGITSRLNQELDITGLPPSFYMNLPELFTRNNKKNGQCFRHNFTQKYANRDIIAGITSRLNQELDITGLPPSFYMNLPELFTRNNKKMVNVFDTISLKNMQIVILLLELHHDSIRN